MEKVNYNKEDLIFSLDIGTRSIIGTVGIIKDKKYNVICEKYKEHEERAMIDGQIHDINLVAKTVMDVKKALEKEIGHKLETVSIAAAGRFLRTSEALVNISLNGDEEINKDIIRSLELSAVKKAEEEVSKVTEGKMFCVGYSVKGYYLNSYIISNLLGHKGEKIGADVIATFLPRSVVDSLYSVMEKVNLVVTNLTLEPIAAIEAAVPKKLRLLNIALVDIGAGTSDIAISSKETISAYGMVPMAGDEITEVIAQEYLIDFNEAERIKKEISEKEEIEYTDILGIDNVVSSESVKKLIRPIIKKLGEIISNKIIEINGNKSPAAVFLVGGGAHTPFIIDEIAENLGIPSQRIAIKDRRAVEECISDNALGSAGVTVLGIALSAIRKLGDNFIDVELNGEIISMFNSKKNTILDVLLQAGVNPALLIPKNGKSKRFTINGNKRIVFGSLGENAVIKMNGVEVDTEAVINAGDVIEVVFAKNGSEAVATVSEYAGNFVPMNFYLNGQVVSVDPVCLINGEKKDFSEKINNNDEVTIFIPSKVKDIKKYVLNDDYKLFIDDNEIDDDYIINEGEYIYSKIEEIEEASEELENKSTEEVIPEEKLLEENNKGKNIRVVINNNEVTLTGKDSYIFVDIFNFFDFDLNSAPGKKINLLLNGNRASYLEKLNDADIIEVFWS